MSTAVVITNDWWWGLKITWTISAAIGVILIGVLFGMAISDYKLLAKTSINGWRRYVAKTSCLIFVGGLGTQVVYLIAGVIGLTRPNPPRGYHIDWVSWFELSMFIFAIWLANVLALIIYVRRRKVLEVIEEHLGKERESGYQEGHDAASDKPAY